MSARFLCALALAVHAGAVVASSLSNHGIEQVTDRFTGTSSLIYKSQLSERHSKFQLGQDQFHAQAETKNGETTYSVFILTGTLSNRHGGGWRYLHVERVHWLVDGNPMDAKRPAVIRHVARGAVVEGFSQPLSKEAFAAMGSAGSIEFRLGSDEYKLARKDIDAMRVIAEHAQ